MVNRIKDLMPKYSCNSHHVPNVNKCSSVNISFSKYQKMSRFQEILNIRNHKEMPIGGWNFMFNVDWLKTLHVDWMNEQLVSTADRRMRVPARV